MILYKHKTYRENPIKVIIRFYPGPQLPKGGLNVFNNIPKNPPKPSMIMKNLYNNKNFSDSNSGITNIHLNKVSFTDRDNLLTVKEPRSILEQAKQSRPDLFSKDDLRITNEKLKVPLVTDDKRNVLMITDGKEYNSRETVLRELRQTQQKVDTPDVLYIDSKASSHNTLPEICLPIRSKILLNQVKKITQTDSQFLHSSSSNNSIKEDGVLQAVSVETSQTSPNLFNDMTKPLADFCDDVSGLVTGALAAATFTSTTFSYDQIKQTATTESSSIAKSLDDVNADAINKIPQQGHVESVTLKDPNGLPYTTTITQETLFSDLTTNQLREECLKRKLIKETKSPCVIIETENAGFIRVGNPKDNLVFTKNGIAYRDKFFPFTPSYVTDATRILPLFMEKHIDNLCIVVVKKSNSEECLVKSSQHMLAAFDDFTGRYYLFQKLTSQKNPSFLEIKNKQFGIFQKESHGCVYTQVEKESDHYKKTQQLAPLNNISLIAKDQVHTVTHSKDYFASLDQRTKLELTYILNDQVRSSNVVKYQENNVTDQQLFTLCKEMDKEGSKLKPKHPETKEISAQKAAAAANNKPGKKYDK